MDCIVQGVAESQTGLSDFHFHFSRLKVLRSIGLRINIPSLERVEKCIHFLFVFFIFWSFIILYQKFFSCIISSLFFFTYWIPLCFLSAPGFLYMIMLYARSKRKKEAECF